ncbi:hypothetical protein [Novosphingobium guangzhouense]|uniref:Uncharacterized protein n=1 Tax=Novosphingobium guangzhouense TaxID=1850347 RepID=A0A2K2G4D4_9SPHN|nr:hypothetical protein [Novosphingobium guangzhouense]PNU05894.1 hypothetical protein A8V01_13870 [Novosphingobium guangzhouense]
MKPAHFLVPVALAALALGGCGKKADDQPKTAAGGELLPRSVSDDMLPYDTVKSQASLSDPNAGLGLPRTGGPAALPSEEVDDSVAGDADEPATVIDAPPAPPVLPASPPTPAQP